MDTAEKALVRIEASFWALKNGSWNRVLNFFFDPATWQAKNDEATQLKVVNTRYYSDGEIATGSLEEASVIDLQKLPWGWSMAAEPRGEKIASVEELYFLKGAIATADVQPVSLYFGEALNAARNIRDVIGFQVVEKDFYDSGEYIPRKLRYIFFKEPEDLKTVSKAEWLPEKARKYLKAEMPDYKFIHIPEERILYPFRGEYVIISENLRYE